MSSTEPAFEVDNIARSPVPEPAISALLAGGFLLVGVARRRAARRTVVAYAFAAGQRSGPGATTAVVRGGRSCLPPPHRCGGVDEIWTFRREPR